MEAVMHFPEKNGCKKVKRAGNWILDHWNSKATKLALSLPEGRDWKFGKQHWTWVIGILSDSCRPSKSARGKMAPLITWLLHVSSLFWMVSTIIAHIVEALEGRINVGSGKINRRSERDFLSSFISIEALPNVSHSLYLILRVFTVVKIVVFWDKSKDQWTR